jgi:hypothetical protein
VQDQFLFDQQIIGLKNCASGTPPFLCLFWGQRDFLEMENYWRVIAKMKYVHFQGSMEALTGCAKRHHFRSMRSAGVLVRREASAAA